jgi:KaiC/GvpD/RAD55 family RecA-like ATPase|tara:strand:+ start:2647 stop:4065 length:1419 start_codon:yes stop_codon:yes gene_type:complete
MQNAALDLTGNPSCFSHYGKQFQEKIFQGLLLDRVWAAQMHEVMRSNFFEVNYLQYLTRLYFKYYIQYKAFPTLQLLITIIKGDLSEGNDIILRDQIVEFLHRIKSNPHPGDIGYVKDKTLDFCKRQAFKDALHQAVELIQTEKFDSVISLMKEAVSVGMPHSIGHDFIEDIEARFVESHRLPCPTGLPRIDAPDILDGGLGRGEIGVVTANTGVGKSHYLVAMGANALRAGKNVLHYTFELSETAVGRRYDSNLTNIDVNELMSSKKEVLDFYDKNDMGRLIIKEYPTGSASIITIRNHIEKLSLKGFRPNLLVIDYADIMRSTKAYDSLRHELKLVYEELRNLAMEMNIPVWTASQANRDSANSDIVGLENMAEAYGKAMVSDVVISLSRKAQEKATGHGRLFVAKNRAGRDGILFPMMINTAQSRITLLDESELTLNEAVNQDAGAAKDLLRAKWNEVKKKLKDVDKDE